MCLKCSKAKTWRNLLKACVGGARRGGERACERGHKCGYCGLVGITTERCMRVACVGWRRQVRDTRIPGGLKNVFDKCGAGTRLYSIWKKNGSGNWFLAARKPTATYSISLDDIQWFFFILERLMVWVWQWLGALHAEWGRNWLFKIPKNMMAGAVYGIQKKKFSRWVGKK